MYKVLEFFYKVLRRIKYINVNNKVILDELYQEDCYKYLKRKYYKYLNKNITEKCGNSKESNIIWTCWLQGEENAPLLVKKCIDSLRKIKGTKLIVIDNNNLNKYVSFPKYIIEKKNKGIISNAHFSDLIRLDLLIRYGGLWVDPTVLCTGDLFYKKIKKDDLFLFQNIILNDRDYLKTNISNWLIYAKNNNNKFLIQTQNLLYEYWKHEKFAKNYFIFHILFYIVYEHYKDEWHVRKYSNINPHILQKELFNKYSKTRFEEIKEMSDFHKLNWRINDINEDSFYSYIVKEL